MGTDAGYVGATKREEMQKKLQTMPYAARWHIAKCRKPIRERAECGQKDLALTFEKLKARYKGLTKNNVQLNVLFALSNLYMIRKKLCP